MPRYTYILVCTDLPLAQQMVQAAHAAQESGKALSPRDSTIDYLVLCAVSNGWELTSAQAKLHEHGIHHLVVHEPDLKHRATALVTEPLVGARRQVLRDYPLWKPSHAEVVKAS